MTSRDDWFAAHILPLESRVRSWLRKAGWTHADVEDLIQESYARIAAHGVADIGHPSGYFFRTVRNVAADVLRRQQVISLRSVVDMSVIDDGVDTETTLSAREELEQLRQAIEHLPPRCRTVFILRKVEGLSQAETARRMGVSENTIEKQVARGMRLCAAWLTKETENEPPAPGLFKRRRSSEGE